MRCPKCGSEKIVQVTTYSDSTHYERHLECSECRSMSRRVPSLNINEFAKGASNEKSFFTQWKLLKEEWK